MIKNCVLIIALATAFSNIFPQGVIQFIQGGQSLASRFVIPEAAQKDPNLDVWYSDDHGARKFYALYSYVKMMQELQITTSSTNSVESIEQALLEFTAKRDIWLSMTATMPNAFGPAAGDRYTLQNLQTYAAGLEHACKSKRDRLEKPVPQGDLVQYAFSSGSSFRYRMSAAARNPIPSFGALQLADATLISRSLATGGCLGPEKWLANLGQEGRTQPSIPEKIEIGPFLKAFTIPLPSDPEEANFRYNQIYAKTGLVRTPKEEFVILSPQHINYARAEKMQEQTKARNRVISIGCDISGSMDMNSNRWSQTQKITLVRQMVDALVREGNRPEDTLTVYTFNTEVNVVLSLDGDKERFLQSGAKDMTPGGMTDIPNAFTEGLAYVRQMKDNQPGLPVTASLVLITDAVSTVYNREFLPEDLLEKIATASADGINVIVVGVGDDFNETLIKDITQYPGASYIFVHNQQTVDYAIQQFPYQMAPNATNIKISIEKPGQKLLAVYGANQEEGQQPDSSAPIKIATLLTTPPSTTDESVQMGGGAVVLVYKTLDSFLPL